MGYTDVNIASMNAALENGANFAADYPDYAKAMWLLISVPPAIGMIISIIPTLKYELDKKTHDNILAALVEKHSDGEDV